MVEVTAEGFLGGAVELLLRHLLGLAHDVSWLEDVLGGAAQKHCAGLGHGCLLELNFFFLSSWCQGHGTALGRAPVAGFGAAGLLSSWFCGQ